MEQQATLFTPHGTPTKEARFEPQTNARRSDPESSKEAGRKAIASGLISGQHRLILGYLNNYPNDEGWTAREIEKAMGHIKAHKRMKELETIGLVRKGDRRECAASEHEIKVTVWHLTQKGKDSL